MKNIATLLLLMVIKVAEILFWEGCILSEKIFFYCMEQNMKLYVTGNTLL